MNFRRSTGIEGTDGGEFLMVMQDQRTGPAAFSVMAKVVGPLCNLDCTYCFYLGKDTLYPEEKNWKMPPEVLESFIRQNIEAQDVPAVTFVWQGGEPTIPGVDYFRNVIELEKKFASGKQISNAIQTNGILLDDEWCSFLADNQFLVGLSIDGPREIHDRYRVRRSGAGSFDEVMRGVGLLKKHKVEFNTLTVVHRHNARYPVEIYRFLKEIGSRYLQFIPIVERAAVGLTEGDSHLVPPAFGEAARVTDWSVEPLQYGKFLSSIFDEWVRKDVGTIFVQPFDVALESWMGMEPNLCLFRTTCGDAVALEHNGDLYSCDHFVYRDNLLGNILNESLGALVRSAPQLKFGKNKRETLPELCRQCPVRFACNGECPKHRFAETPDGHTGMNYLCEGYKYFFHHIDPAMRFMADKLRHEQPPADVMRWMRQMDDAPQGRNEPCYCGSGKKFKQCHGG